jgi:ATP-dependent DNA helicase RecG
LEVAVEDETGRMHINWFNQPWVARALHPDMRIRVHGSLTMHKGFLQMNNPRWEEIDDDEPTATIEGDLRPVYRANEHISSSVIAKLITGVLDDALPEIDDHLTDEMLRELEMPKLADAYAMCHKPEEEAQAKEGRRRIAYDELLLLQLGVMMKRHHRRDTMHAPKLEWNNEIKKRIEARIPYTLTNSQQQVIEEIANDIMTSIPMNRLLQGDVGSGKTVVALHAMLMAVTCGAQAAMMAPTELLAEQHFQTISNLLKGSKVKTALLTSSLSGKDRKKLISKISEGDIDIVVGTHALLTDDVVFSNIAIAITD